MIRERTRVVVRGAVQGVGFRPFVYRLATELRLEGWVSNSVEGVFIEVEGVRDVLNRFLVRLQKDKPPRAVLQSFESIFLDPVNYSGFEIRESEENGEKTALILPDIATCADCLREICDPGDRRFGYPFTNCTNCGPRFSIIEALPYDRAHTSMSRFTMCIECEREYYDPRDRRFHAQPNACPRCGPQLELWDSGGRILAAQREALRQAVESVRAGKILALKGIGGFSWWSMPQTKQAWCNCANASIAKKNRLRPWSARWSQLNYFAAFQSWRSNCCFHRKHRLSCWRDATIRSSHPRSRLEIPTSA
jgi:hydrogenase maturation protein HypF